MTTIEHMLDTCRAELGYHEIPAGSNLTKYAKVAKHPNGYPWCATFTVAMAKLAGLVIPEKVNETAHTWTALAAWRAAGLGDPHPSVGAFVYFEIGTGNGHVGICESFDDLTVTSIDGNTSATAIGSQNNGGMVARKTRSRYLVAGYGTPVYGLAEVEEMTHTHVVTIQEEDRNAAGYAPAMTMFGQIKFADVISWRPIGEGVPDVGTEANGLFWLMGPGQYHVVTR
jgi:hypothetical protein